MFDDEDPRVRASRHKNRRNADTSYDHSIEFGVPILWVHKIGSRSIWWIKCSLHCGLFTLNGRVVVASALNSIVNKELSLRNLG